MAGPILLLHGIPVTGDIWRPVVAGLEKHGPVLAPDLLGFGNAPHPDIAYGPEDYDLWLQRDVLSATFEPVTLVVHDFGGPVGLFWAVRHPERVARIVIMNTSVYPEETALATLVRFPRLVNLLLRGPLLRWQMRFMFRCRDQALTAQAVEVYGRTDDQRTLIRIVREWTPGRVRAIAGQLHRLTCPVLLLWGLDDRYIFPWQPHGRRFQQDFPAAAVAHIRDAAHFLQAEQPGQVLGCIEAFLSGANS